MNDLISVQYLAQNSKEYFVLDCRPVAEYMTAHIAGAQTILVDYWLKERDVDGSPRGLHVMGINDFCALAFSLGIVGDAPVVLYDDNQGRGAARVRWVLKYYGHSSVSILEGGWQEWNGEQQPLSFEALIPTTASSYQAKIQPHLLTDRDTLRRNLDNLQIVDARSLDEYTGADSHGNPRAGRIPGARHLPWDSLMEGCCFKSSQVLKKIVEDAGLSVDKRTVTYCQAGVRASHVAFVLSQIGFNQVSVYDGSMREWSASDSPMVSGA